MPELESAAGCSLYVMQLAEYLFLLWNFEGEEIPPLDFNLTDYFLILKTFARENLKILYGYGAYRN